MKNKIEKKKRIGKIGALIVLGIFTALMLAQPVAATDYDTAGDGYVGNSGADRIFFDNTNGEIEILGAPVGIGTTGPDAKLDIFDTSGAQLRLTYADGTTFCDFQVDSVHDLTIRPSSNGQIKLQPTIDSTDFFQVWNAAQIIPVLNVDTVNYRVGIRTQTPDVALDVEIVEGGGPAATIGSSMCQASEDYSVAMGSSTASGRVSTSMGFSTVASGFASTTMGCYTTASNQYTVAMGYDTTASGFLSIAMGQEIEATGSHSVAIALSDQNGLQVTQANTMAIMGGNVGIGTASPQRALHISDVMRLEPRSSAPSSPSEGDIYVDSTTNHIYVYLGGLTPSWVQLDNDP